MLNELFKLFSEQAVAAAKATVTQIKGDAPDTFAVLKPDGSVERIVIEAHPRNHQASSLDAIVQYVVAAETPTTIWFNRDCVVGILDDGTRRDRITLRLAMTPQLARLLKLEPRYDQKAFLRLLRIDLDGCIPDSRLIESARKVRWEAESKAGGDIVRGKESLGKAITQALTNVDELPAETTLQVQIFANLLTPLQAIRCAIEPDVAAQKFEFVPYPGEIEKAIQRAEADIGVMLLTALGDERSEGVKVCYGQP